MASFDAFDSPKTLGEAPIFLLSCVNLKSRLLMDAKLIMTEVVH